VGSWRKSSSSLAVLPPTEAITDVVNNWKGGQDLFLLLADAATADVVMNTADVVMNAADVVTDVADVVKEVADVATEAATSSSNAGWWASYLNIFKTCLLFVHNTIDEPFRNMGLTQTWGPSIAIFTACKSIVMANTNIVYGGRSDSFRSACDR